MLHSLSAQVSAYSAMIQQHPGWQYAGVYADEGRTGTKEKRPEFSRLIADCRAGKVDLIIAKSISRFMHNTIPMLEITREIVRLGVDVFLEKENIWTFDGKGEFLITIMASLAQEESRSISENVTWGQRKRFADGKFSVAYSHFLGYEKDEEDNLRIVPEQAKIIRLIYKFFLEGKTTQGIANYLMEHGVPPPRRKTTLASVERRQHPTE